MGGRVCVYAGKTKIQGAAKRRDTVKDPGGRSKCIKKRSRIVSERNASDALTFPKGMPHSMRDLRGNKLVP